MSLLLRSQPTEACRHRRAVLTGVVRLSRRSAERRRGEKAEGIKREGERKKGGKKEKDTRYGGGFGACRPTGRSTVPLPSPYKPATRYTPSTPSRLVLLDFDCAGAEEAAEHGGTLLAI